MSEQPTASEPRGSTALRIVSTLLPTNAALLELSTGNMANAYAMFVGMGVSALLATIDAQHKASGKEPDYAKLGTRRVMSMAEHAVQAPSVVQDIWRRLLVQATDPANTEFEVRQSDLELIDSLNPSDAILILGYGVKTDPKLKWIDEWRMSDQIQRLAVRASRHGTTAWLKQQIEVCWPLRFAREYANAKIGAKATVSDQSLLVGLSERTDGKPGPAPLFSGVQITASWHDKIKKGFADERVQLSHDWGSELDSNRDEVLVAYRLLEPAERLRYLLGLTPKAVPQTGRPQAGSVRLP